MAGGRGIRGGDNRRFKGGNKHNIPNAHVRSEIKNNEQVRKERQKKVTQISQMKNNKSKKGKKFGGKNGKRGKGKSR